MRKIITWTILASMLVAQPAAFAEKYAQETPQLTNVELNERNELEGRLLDVTGKPVANAKITVRSQKQLNEVERAVASDAEGRFVLTGLHTGRVVFDVEKETYGVQAWKKGTAPPKSLTSVSVVQESALVRSQNNCRPTLRDRIRCMSPKTKLCLGLLIATAIILPIALDDDDAS